MIACKNEFVATVDTDQNLNIWSLKTHQVTNIIIQTRKKCKKKKIFERKITTSVG